MTCTCEIGKVCPECRKAVLAGWTPPAPRPPKPLPPIGEPGHTEVSWTEFCQWVSGRTVDVEGPSDGYSAVTIHFKDGSRAVVSSAWTGAGDYTPPDLTEPEVEVFNA